MRKLHKCKITVLDRMLVEDIAREYSSDPNLGPCDIYENGQEFILTENEKPEGFCSWAWLISKDNFSYGRAICPGLTGMLFRLYAVLMH